MELTKEWLELWKEKKDLLRSPNNFNEYFTAEKVSGQKLDTLSLGLVSVPSGEILVRDPLVYLEEGEKPYFLKVPTGEFEAVACVVLANDDCARYAAIKVNFTNKTAVKFEEALTGDENLDTLKNGEYFGFCVDAGLAAILDKKTADAYVEFFNNWYKNNPDGNNYDDYFAELFAKSYKENPKYQRPGGDWINWTIPNTGLHMPIFQSGFGDGVYPVYFGFDEDDNICCLVVELIDIKLAYNHENISDCASCKDCDCK